MTLSRLPIAFALSLLCALAATAQQPTEQRSGIAEAATATDTKGAAVLEARLLTTALNGSQDSPVMNTRVAIKNVSPNFYTYVSGLVTFYDANAVRCGEGMFKVEALAVNESAEADTPGLRLRCSPASWRVVASNLMMRSAEMPKPAETVSAPNEPVVEKPAPINFIISIDGEEHPIQVNNPIVLKLANRNRKIVLKPIQ
jgi:hypothetical protein